MEPPSDEAVALSVLRQLVTQGVVLWQGAPSIETNWVCLETDWVELDLVGAALMRRLAREVPGNPYN